MLRSFIQMSALILTLGASIFLLKSNLGMTPDNIANLSSTRFDFSQPIAETFTKQAADTRVGLILLLSAFILQMINALWPMRWKDFGIDWHGVLIAIGFAIVLLTFSHWYSKYLAEQNYKNTLDILQNERK